MPLIELYICSFYIFIHYYYKSHPKKIPDDWLLQYLFFERIQSITLKSQQYTNQPMLPRIFISNQYTHQSFLPRPTPAQKRKQKNNIPQKPNQSSTQISLLTSNTSRRHQPVPQRGISRRCRMGAYRRTRMHQASRRRQLAARSF